MYSKAISWLTKKWKAVVAFVGLVSTAILFYLRAKGQKKVLEKANESHEKENQANEKALKDLAEGLQDIGDEEAENIEASLREHSRESKDLEKKKEDFVEKAAEDPDLAKNLAEKIGARFVENKD